MICKLRLFPAMSLTLLSALAVPATAQEFPTRTVTIVVAQGPGGATDLAPRLLAPEMSKFLGQSVVVENRAGASNLIGYEYVARQAPADGHTLLLVTSTGHSILPLIVRDIRFDPLKELPPVLGFGHSRLVLSSSAQEPWKSFQEMVGYAKANPGKLNYASSSASTRLQTEAMLRSLGINVVYVPYKTTIAGMTSILSRESNMGLMNEAQATAMGEKLRVLAVTGDKRSPNFPQVPTFRELGLGQMSGFTLLLHVRAGTPRAATDKLYAAVQHALRQPDVKAGMSKLELEYIDLPAAAAAKHLAEQSRFFAETAKQIGLQPE